MFFMSLFSSMSSIVNRTNCGVVLDIYHEANFHFFVTSSLSPKSA